MVEEDKILTLHPDGKKGVRLSLQKYELIKDTILEILRENGEISWKDLGPLVKGRSEGSFEGSIIWYFTSIKLDLQARGMIKIRKNGGNQFVSIVDENSNG